ncbi:MAG: hypothetical protein QF659_07270 [Dehalococcoidia bacterium]|jgi:hypothetical protein|nr:hypothetical protein [Dehalococcoidia bacterium]
MAQSQETHRPPARSVLETHVTVTAATYAAKAGDRLIGVNRAGAVTVTLPTAQVRPGRCYTVKDESGAAATNNITVATERSETIDGSATDTISENYGAKTYYADGSNWFTVPLLAVGSHTLASHSSEAHSELTGVGADDHHSEAHQAAHNSGGADALKLDDLAAPDDNTDLDFSTSAHGLVPKGTNTGNFLKDDGTWSAAGGGPDQATQAEAEAESDVDKYLPPDLLHFGPWAAKVWAVWTGTSTVTLLASYNVDSITAVGTGQYTVNITTDFSSDDYAQFAWQDDGDRNRITSGGGAAAKTAGAFQVMTSQASDQTAVDSLEVSAGAFGDQ